MCSLRFIFCLAIFILLHFEESVISFIRHPDGNQKDEFIYTS